MPKNRHPWLGDLAILIYLATATVIVHLFTGGRYGFHRDELATLDDARHLAWGYVAYPPVTPFFGRLSLQLFGSSLTGFRFFAAIACAVSVLLAGLMARELGGGRGAQWVAAMAAAPFSLGAGSLMQYVSFDYLWWVLLGYLFIRLIKSGDARWWIAIGVVIGLGLLTKYTMAFCATGIVVAVVTTNMRAHLKSKWLWIGVACSVLIFLPNFIWQFNHDFVSLEFLRHIHERDVRIGRTRDFLPDQLKLTFLAAPLAAAGLYFFFFGSDSARFRGLGWLYVIPFLLFVFARGRGYYLAPAYPSLYAGGSVLLEKCVAGLRPAWARPVRLIVPAVLLINIGAAAAFALPLAPINSRWWDVAITQNGDFAEEIGWPELVETIALIRDSLAETERSHFAILVGNYGEAGAVNFYGPGHGLPAAISGINSFWARGYGDPPPEMLIVVGFSKEFLQEHFNSCEAVARSQNRFGVANEETSRHPEIFLCRGLRGTWPNFWNILRSYG